MAYFLKKTKKGFIFKSMKAITIRSVKVAHIVLINRLAMSTNFRQTALKIRLLFSVKRYKNSIRNIKRKNRLKKNGRYQKNLRKNSLATSL